MPTWLRSLSFRTGVSLALAVLPAYLLFILLRAAGGALGVDIIGGAVDTLINTHLPWLTTVSDSIKQHPAWAPFLSIWAAGAFTVYKAWSSRIEFFAVSGQDYSTMQPRPGLTGHEGIVPWVEASESSMGPRSPLPEPQSVKTWADQRAATQALLAWIHDGSGDGRWGRFWPRQPTAGNIPGWQPLKLALLTGANGVGKSALVAALGNRLATGCFNNWARADSDHDFMFHRQQLQAGVGAWTRRMLPWLRRQTNDPWDVGVLTSRDELQRAALNTWEPRRPTLLIVDEPDGRTSEALRILSSRRNAFWYPVRVLMIDQAFPLALDDYVPSPATTEWPALPLEHSKELNLGDVHFDEGAVRALWSALCEEQGKLWANRPAGDQVDKRDFIFVSKKLWGADEVLMLLKFSGPNPLHIALALAELVGTRQTVYEMCRTAIGGQASTAINQEAQLQVLDGLDRSLLSHRLIAQRAADLVITYESILRQQAPGLEHEVMLAVAAATVTGGLSLPRELSVRLNASILGQMFPGTRLPGSNLGVQVPPVRPTVVARAFLEQWIGARAAPEALAADVAAFAWRHNPEGALHALHEGNYLPDTLRGMLAAVAAEQAQYLPWAQGCCAAMMCSDASAEPFVAALDGLTTVELLALDCWLEGRIAPQHPRRPDPLSVLVALSRIAVRRAAIITGGLLSADTDARIKTFVHWAALAGDTGTHRVPRRRALATAVAALLRSIAGAANTGTETQWQLVDELLRACYGKGRETNLAACRHLIRHARSIDGATGDPAGAAADPAAALTLIRAWSLACHVASQLGGERALELAQTLADRVEAIVKARPDFAAHAGLQKERATAWGYATWAASQLGGERALKLAQTLADRVETIVKARPDFAAHAGLQKERATAWCNATYAASQLGGERALELAQTLAGRVETIVTARPDFAAHAGLQKERATAWRCATYAASQLGGERALELAQTLAGQVEAVVTAQPDFAAHAGLQEERATAWRCATYAASRLGGERALELAQTLAGQVEAVVTAQPDFAAHAGLQEERATAWRYATYAASQLSGERALELAQTLAGQVEAVVTAQPDFAAHAGLQEERATAWRFVTEAASRLRGERGQRSAVAAARRVRDIVFARRWEDPRPFEGEWEKVRNALLLLGIGLTDTVRIEFTWATSAAAPSTSGFAGRSGVGLLTQNEPRSEPGMTRSDSEPFSGDRSGLPD